MKAPFLRFLKAASAVAAIVLLATSFSYAAGQTDPPASAVDSLAAPAPDALARIVVIGASVTAGYATTNLPGNSSGELCRLNHYFDCAITAPHEPVRNLGSPLFFMSAEASGHSQIDLVLQIKPSLVAGVDFLFWFCYGSRLTEAQRVERFDHGLKLLEAIPCPLIVGDIPDVSAATNGILSPDELPAPETMREVNRRLRSWAANHPQVCVVDLSSLMRSFSAGQPIVVHGIAVSSNQVRRVQQPDRLHLLPGGCAVLTLAALDSIHSIDIAGRVRWDAGELEQRAVAAITKAWPDLTTMGTVFDPFNAPLSGASLKAFPAGLSFSQDVVSDGPGHYSIIWRTTSTAQIRPPQPLVLARDAAHNWAALVKTSTTNSNLDIHLQPGLTLSGHIEDSAGHPLTNATLQTVLASAETSFAVLSLSSFENRGAFAFRALPQGQSYQISAAAPGHGRATILLSAEKTQTNLIELPPIVLKSADLAVAGQVLGLDHQPCAGAAITVADPNQPVRPLARSDARGHFLIQGVCDGPLTLRVSLVSTNRNTAALTSVVQARAGDTNVIVNLQNPR